MTLPEIEFVDFFSPKKETPSYRTIRWMWLQKKGNPFCRLFSNEYIVKEKQEYLETVKKIADSNIFCCFHLHFEAFPFSSIQSFVFLDGFSFCFVLFWFYIRNSQRRNVFSWLVKKPKFFSLHANIEKPSGLRITFSDRTGHDYGYNRTTEIARNHVHLMITTWIFLAFYPKPCYILYSEVYSQAFT